MKKGVSFLPFMICLGIVCLSCSKKQEGKPPPARKTEAAVTEATFYADNLLSGDTDTLQIKRLGVVEKIMPTGADSSAKSRVEQYLSYNLIGTASADYAVRGIPVSAEVAQFASIEDAYGFYSHLRPIGVGDMGLGTESFSQGKVRYFTRGEFVVKLSTQKEDSIHSVVQFLLGKAINRRISGLQTPPPFFMLFPMAGKMAFTNRYYPRDFLNVTGLDKVYTTSFDTGGDTAVLFLTMDESGDRFVKLREYAEAISVISTAPKSFPYEGYSVAFSDPSHGRIVAGLVRSKLVGIIGYDSTKNDRLASLWVQGLR